MKYAVIRTGGKQYRVSEGDVIEVERLQAEPEQEYRFSDVLLYTVDEARYIGMPLLTDVVVKAKVLGEVRGEKIRVSHFKAKARYRKTTGHRQTLTKIQIASIQKTGEEATKKEEPKKTVNEKDKTKK